MVAAGLEQHEVQRQLGRCLMRLQQYEQLMKRILAVHVVGGTASDVQSAYAQRTAEIAKSNLGDLAQRLFKNFIVPDDAVDDVNSTPTLVSPTEITITTTVRIEMERERYDITKQAVKDLVDLRNTLVHHFLELFDVWTVEGCANATEYLAHTFKRVDEQFAELLQWSETVDLARLQMAEHLQTPGFAALLVESLGQSEPGRPNEGMVSSLRAATAECAIDGWTPLRDAIAFVARGEPDQTPERYGCRSWPQLLHESKVFELRYTREPDAGKVAWYRERPKRR
ncbi:MAG: OST-HTH/LOTUS domain-containing protein [Pseudomonadota bacterium]